MTAERSERQTAEAIEAAKPFHVFDIERAAIRASGISAVLYTIAESNKGPGGAFERTNEQLCEALLYLSNEALAVETEIYRYMERAKAAQA